MHLALKSAMSRIPYTNKVGETIGSIADPAAAYSLRALNGGDPMVARVRRSSDNTEKNFTASDVSGGALVDWVNEGYLSDLTNTWSLGNSNTNFLSNTSSANQITATANSSAGTSGARLLYPFDSFVAEVGSTITATFNVTAITGSVDIKYTLSPFPVPSSGGPVVTINNTGTFTYSHTATNKAYGLVGVFGADDAIEAELTSLTVSGEVVNGHVTTWYDQSGNDNHATQSTAGSQPKIVDGGTLVSDGIKFDGVDDYLDSTNDISSPFWSFITHKATKNNSAVFGTKSLDSWIGRRSTGSFLQYVSSLVVGGSYPSSTIIRTDQADGIDSKIFLNGTSVTTGDSGSARPNFGRIGTQGTLDSAKFLGGNIQEMIIYNTDQSANRTAIEANINNHYDIY